ncbi:MAG: MoaD/ThiS family protein [Desulfobacula sp.]|uniref:MoaD/ThiS family protein n=1 Tax=Desulfobacula sp. TaxID=2593537 RepID=UPI0025BAEAB8|nr:MoaD/ThiS family protein [Desulfobacula sp.]MCD4718784.1 MoaD/ThiS family protein [Desulfobacula sp.]
MIKIDLKLFVTLSKYFPKDSEYLEIPEGTSVERLMSDLGIPGELVKLIFINGKRQDSKYRLENNDRVGLFPPVGGG